MRSVILSILLGVSILVFFPACKENSKGRASGGAPASDATTASQKDIDRFTVRSGIVIPPTCKVTAFRAPMSMDGVMMMKLELPTGDLANFLRASGLVGKLTNTTRESASGEFGDFIPAHPKKFREGQKSLGKGEYLNVLVDEDSAAIAVLYMHWFGT